MSVCIPVYNAAKFLEDCIQSVLNQTYSNLEILLVDNGSDDDSLSIAKSFTDKRVIVDVELNKGAANARNKLLSLVKGKYIQFMDADDMLSADKIESQVLALEKKKGHIAVCNTVHFFDNEPLSKFKPSPYEEQFLYTTNAPIQFIINLWGGNNFKASMVQPNAWLVPDEIIKKAGTWNETLTLDDDGEFFSRVILNSKGIVKTAGFNYYRKYLFSKENLSSKINTEGLRSLIKSAFLKESLLFTMDSGKKAQKAIYMQLIELQIKCYLTEPALYDLLSLKLKQFPKWKFNPRLGGTFVNTMSKYFGWKFAKWLQRIYYKISQYLKPY